MATERCPSCHRGQKVPATYTLPGTDVEKDCSYCGWCGKDWPQRPPRDPKKAAANDAD